MVPSQQASRVKHCSKTHYDFIPTQTLPGQTTSTLPVKTQGVKCVMEGVVTLRICSANVDKKTSGPLLSSRD